MALWPLLNHRKIQSLELLQKAEKMSIYLIVMPITQLCLNQSILDFFRQQLYALWQQFSKSIHASTHVHKSTNGTDVS